MCVLPRVATKTPACPLSLYLSPIHPPGSRPTVPGSQPAEPRARRAPQAGPTARARARSQGAPPGRGWRPRAQQPWTRREDGRGRGCGDVSCGCVGGGEVSRRRSRGRTHETPPSVCVSVARFARPGSKPSGAQARLPRVPIPPAPPRQHLHALPVAQCRAHNSPCRQPLGCAERGADAACHCSSSRKHRRRE